MVVIIVICYLLFPILAIDLCRRFPTVNKLGPVIICYLAGIVAGNLGSWGAVNKNILDFLTTITIPIALPLLLFSLNIRHWVRLAGKTAISLGLITASVIIMAACCHFIFETYVKDAWKISGLMVGVYTGGTPNLAAIKTALAVDPNIYLAVHSADVAVGAVYIFFAITIGQSCFLYILPKFESTGRTSLYTKRHSFDDYTGIFSRPILTQLIQAVGLSSVIFLFGAGVSFLVPPSYAMAAAILTITTLGMTASLFNYIRNIPMTFQLGQYFILIFCLAVASMVDIQRLFQAAPVILVWVAIMVSGAMGLHVGLAKWFKIDADTVLITSVAAICSPPFVPMVAGALKNKEIVVSGLTTGIIGYAIGNYLGVVGAYLLRGL